MKSEKRAKTSERMSDLIPFLPSFFPSKESALLNVFKERLAQAQPF
jgi:hypothetical protein